MTTQKEIDRLVKKYEKGKLTSELLRVELELIVAMAQREQMIENRKHWENYGGRI